MAKKEKTKKKCGKKIRKNKKKRGNGYNSNSSQSLMLD